MDNLHKTLISVLGTVKSKIAVTTVTAILTVLLVFKAVNTFKLSKYICLATGVHLFVEAKSWVKKIKLYKI